MNLETQIKSAQENLTHLHTQVLTLTSIKERTIEKRTYAQASLHLLQEEELRNLRKIAKITELTEQVRKKYGDDAANVFVAAVRKGGS